MRGYRQVFFLGGLALLTAGCTLIEYDQLVPFSKAAFLIQSERNLALPTLPFKVSFCRPSTPTVNALEAGLKEIQTNHSNLWLSLPPALREDVVVQALTAQSKYVSTAATLEALRLVNRTPTGGFEQHIFEQHIRDSPKPPPITSPDFYSFTAKVANALRRTPSTLDEALLGNWFWSKLQRYYAKYVSKEFVNSFAQLMQPSLAINDDQISQATLVFVELLIDEILDQEVWMLPKTTEAPPKRPYDLYYPGEGFYPATYLEVNGKQLSQWDRDPEKYPFYGCGMILGKAQAVTFLANQFSSVAAAGTSTLVKSAGGIEIGLGILGKLNVGDNSTLTALLTSVTQDVVRRWTIAFTTTVLKAIDIEPNPSSPQNVTPDQRIRVFSSFFDGSAGW